MALSAALFLRGNEDIWRDREVPVRLDAATSIMTVAAKLSAADSVFRDGRGRFSRGYRAFAADGGENIGAASYNELGALLDKEGRCDKARSMLAEIYAGSPRASTRPI